MWNSLQKNLVRVDTLQNKYYISLCQRTIRMKIAQLKSFLLHSAMYYKYNCIHCMILKIVFPQCEQIRFSSFQLWQLERSMLLTQIIAGEDTHALVLTADFTNLDYLKGFPGSMACYYYTCFLCFISFKYMVAFQT